MSRSQVSGKKKGLGIEIVVDLRRQDRGVAVQAAGLEEKTEDEQSELEIGDHSQSNGNSGCTARIGKVDSSPKIRKKHRCKGKFPSINTHPMKTRRKVIWHLEEEISKVIEKGVARGLEKKARLRGLKEGNQSRGGAEVGSERSLWNTEEEVAKVLET
ncbi:hypothetical protein LWI29_010708 [Acer saccharum]|uniref:Uncharacterized protein n=1 Tax=Acer saccharum TaxID=4024 RepID=A0AA39SCX1_ACESA|nr:hypothetical protein LWI29_010708 [Acer saccharum]